MQVRAIAYPSVIMRMVWDSHTVEGKNQCFFVVRTVVFIYRYYRAVANVKV